MVREEDAERMMIMPKKQEGGNESKPIKANVINKEYKPHTFKLDDEKPSNAEKKERRTKYHSHVQPYLMAIKAMMRNGATMEILSDKFQVAVSTLYEYKEKHSEFSEAIKENAEIADFTIEAHLFEMAKTDKVAAFFWLKNRQAKRWRDKQHVFQTGSTVVRKDYEHLTDDELDSEMEQLETIMPGDEQEYEGEGELH